MRAATTSVFTTSSSTGFLLQLVASNQTSHQATASLTFNERVQALPPELFSVVYDFVFECNVDYGESCEEHYRPSVQPQINRASRAAFMARHYRRTTFIANKLRAFPKWLSALEKEVLPTIDRIRPRVLS